MKVHEIVALRERQCIDSVKILRSPSNAKEWVLLFTELGGKSFFLVSDEDRVRCYSSLNVVVNQLDALGFVRAEILF